VWPLGAGAPLRLRGDDGPVSRVQFSADGLRLLRVGTQGYVDLFNAATGTRIRRFGSLSGGAPQSQAPDPVGAGGDSDEAFGAPGGAIFAGGVGAPTLQAVNSSTFVADAGFVRGGREVVLVGAQGVRVVDAATGRSLGRWDVARATHVAVDARGD